MPVYQIGVARLYLVTVDAESQKDAENFASCFVGYRDESNQGEREEFKCNITQIEIVDNETFPAG